MTATTVCTVTIVWLDGPGVGHATTFACLAGESNGVHLPWRAVVVSLMVPPAFQMLWGVVGLSLGVEFGPGTADLRAPFRRTGAPIDA